MKIYSVYDPEFKPYGQVVTGLEDAIREILEALEDTEFWVLTVPAFDPGDYLTD